MSRRLFLVAAMAAAGASDTRAQTPPVAAMSAKVDPDYCVEDAAEFHGVNPVLLRTILRVETRMRPDTIVRNENGTVDVGIAGINSIHFPKLAKWEIGPQDLLDPCVGTYVGAWHLKLTLSNRPETWESIARYHSATPYFNQRYQIMLWNEMVRSGVVQGQRLPVPPLKLGLAKKPAGKNSVGQAVADQGNGVVFDEGRSRQ